MRNENAESVIYKITSPSGKVYIGQTSNFKKRMSYYKSGNCKQQRKLYYSLIKYGFENHSIEILYNSKNDDINTLNDIEKYYISYFCARGLKGLNITEGGDGTKGVKRRSGINHPMFGKTFSDEWKQKISIAKKGKKQSKEMIEARSKKLRGQKRSEHQKQKYSISKIGIKNAMSKETFQFTIEGVFIQSFESASLASKSTNIPHSNICECAADKRKTAGGFKWKYTN